MSKKITFILGSMGGGGAERVTANLAEYFVKRNYKVQIIMLLNNRVDYKLPKEIELTYISTENRNKIIKPILWLTKLRKELKNYRPDVVISFFAKINLLVLFASIGLRLPIFISERNDPKSDRRGLLVRILTYLSYPISKGIVFQTNHAQSCFPRYIQNKSVIIPNPVNIDFDFTKEKRLENTIIAVGKLMDQKNHALLIKAFSLIKDEFPDHRVKIYGEGILRKELTDLINTKDLQDKVFLMGRSFNIYNKIYNADIFVLSSNYEGLSNALLEAMSLETPVISTKCAGSNEIIKDGDNGVLVPINNVIALATALKETINNYDRAINMAQNAKKMTVKYSSENIYREWYNFVTK